MAQRWIATEWGTPDGWRFEEFDVPAPREGEVTIRVQAAGVNPADAKHVAKERPGVALPAAIGYEVSGELTAIGPGTRIASGDAQVGDEVLAFRLRGGFATKVTVRAADVFHKPARLSHEEAANLLLAGTTAAEMLHVAGVRGGETILLHAASGAVGMNVLQLASRIGARVIGTASESNFDRVERYGGIPVAYGPGLVDRVTDAAAGEPIVAGLDAVGTDEAIDASLELVADRDRIVTIIVGPRVAEEGFHLIGGGMPASAAYRDSVRAELIALAGAGRLEVPVSRTYPLADAPEALRFLAEGHPGGKIALIP